MTQLRAKMRFLLKMLACWTIVAQCWSRHIIKWKRRCGEYKIDQSFESSLSALFVLAFQGARKRRPRNNQTFDIAIPR